MIIRRLFSSAVVLLATATGLLAQQNVGIGTTTPHGSAVLDLTSTAQGFLPPRMTTAQRDAIQSPAAGLTIYNTDAGKLNTFDGFRWTEAVQSNGPVTLTFGYTSASQTFTVPAGVTSLQVDMAGTRGRYIDNCSNCYRPGYGGRVQATLTVTPGQVLTIEVGGSRGYDPSVLFQDGGYNGGGRGSEPGGGATDIRIGGTALTNRVLVAGGGGGAGFFARGGHGGGTTGGTGFTATAGSPGGPGIPGSGGTQTAGGADGTPPQQYCYCSAIPAGLGVGGSLSGGTSWGAAGGGGGYYGGGASHGPAGAGGGSSYADPTLASNVVHTQGFQNGIGYVKISFSLPTEAPVISLNNATTSQSAGSVVFSDGNKFTGNASKLFWDNTAHRLGVGIANPQAPLHVAGAARVDALGGTGIRMVTADGNGTLATQALPTDAQQLSISGSTISLSSGGSVTVPADNLGNHTASQNLNLGANQLVGNGGTSGLAVLASGGLKVDAGVIQRGGASITGTTDLGLYSRVSGNFIRLVTNAAPIRFYSDDGAGTTPNVSIESNGDVGIGTGNNTPGNKLDVQSISRSGTHATGRTLYATGDFNEASNGPEFRHSNGTQGVGIGFNSLYAAGSNTNQHLNLIPKGSGGVGIGVLTPTAMLDVNGNGLVRGELSFGAQTKQMLNLYNTDYAIGVQGGTQYFRTGEAFAWYAGGSHNNTQFDAGGGSQQMVLKNGKLGIGAGFTSSALPSGSLEIRQNSPYMVLHSPGNAWASFGLDAADGFKFKLNNGGDFNGANYLTVTGSGYMGLGTTAPAFPLDIQMAVTPGNFAYGFLNGGGQVGTTGSNTGPVSIRATGRVVASEFNATSDIRLKRVIGHSDATADLALLNRIRITDYTMRDSVVHGDRPFKKVIAQEVEQVFPQAVTKHTGFLPDIYAAAVSAKEVGDSVLALELPQPLQVKPAAGQRIRLISLMGETTATVADATASVIMVRGAQVLVGKQVFVFGLEHDDVRAVDYEALAMLNVSATQELARRVAALEAKNAQLQQQLLDETRRASEAQNAAKAEATQLSQRLDALERLMKPSAHSVR